MFPWKMIIIDLFCSVSLSKIKSKPIDFRINIYIVPLQKPIVLCRSRTLYSIYDYFGLLLLVVFNFLFCFRHHSILTLFNRSCFFLFIKCFIPKKKNVYGKENEWNRNKQAIIITNKQASERASHQVTLSQRRKDIPLCTNTNTQTRTIYIQKRRSLAHTFLHCFSLAKQQFEFPSAWIQHNTF